MSDILHLECLNNYACHLPLNTAPAGYVCPICTIPIFSFTPGTVKSPVASLLEQSLANFPWAREGIGLGLMDSSSSASSMATKENDHSFSNGAILGVGGHNGPSLLNDSTGINMPSSASTSNSSFVPKILHTTLPNKPSYSMSTPISVSNVTSFISTNSDLSFGSSSSMRSKFDSESRRSLLANDIVEDKYRTKSPIEFLSRWLR